MSIKKQSLTVLILSTFFFSMLPTDASGGPRRRDAVVFDEPEAPEGIEFGDPLVDECMSELRNDRKEQGLERLQKAAGLAKGDQAKELRLGLVMLHLRNGQVSKAKSLLGPLLKDKKCTPSFARRACLMNRVIMNQKKKDSGGILVPSEEWGAALALATQDIVKEMETTHKRISAAIGKQDWRHMANQLLLAQELVLECAEAKTAHAYEARTKVISRHADGLVGELRQMNGGLNGLLAEAMRLRQAIRDLERPRRTRLPGQGNPDAQAKFKYNECCTIIRRAWEAGMLIDDEFNSVKTNYPDITRGKRAQLKVPEQKLPSPL